MKKIFTIIVSFLPSFAFAQPISDFYSLTDNLTNIGNTVIKLLIAFAVVYIIFRVIQFIIAGDNPEKRSELGKAVLWGIVGLFVILSIWGLVAFLVRTFRTTDNVAPVNSFPRIDRVRP